MCQNAYFRAFLAFIPNLTKSDKSDTKSTFFEQLAQIRQKQTKQTPKAPFLVKMGVNGSKNEHNRTKSAIPHPNARGLGKSDKKRQKATLLVNLNTKIKRYQSTDFGVKC